MIGKTKSYSAPARLMIVLISLLLVAFIGVTDFLTGYEMSFSIFYLIPIILVAWTNNVVWGIAFACVSAAAWLTSDVSSHPVYSHFLIPYWNALVRFCFFLITVVLLSKLKSVLEREEQLARTDPLTGAFNPRSFYESADIEIERSRRSRKPLSLIYIDLDNFKHVNDTLGHGTGNRLLMLVAEIMKNQLREVDVVARLGGDEFAVLLPETDEPGAVKAAGRLRDSLLDSMRHNRWPVTFSIGVAVFVLPPLSAEEMIKRADELMYAVKNSGKDDIRTKSF